MICGASHGSILCASQLITCNDGVRAKQTFPMLSLEGSALSH